MSTICISMCSVPPLLLSQVKLKPWEQRLVDESCGSELQSLLKKAKEWENKYLAALPKPGGYTLMLL